MKRLIILFVTLFVVGTGVFTSFELDTVGANAAIEKSPAYAVVTPEGITKKTKKGRSTFQVNFAYEVAGAAYKFDTKFMEESEAMALAAQKDVQVIFPSNAPDKAMLKSEFESRDRDGSFLHALLKAAGIALFAALIGSAVLAFKFPWFRQSAA